MQLENVLGTVVQGHRVASGQGGDSRFPDATIELQKPAFALRGLCDDLNCLPYF